MKRAASILMLVLLLVSFGSSNANAQQSADPRVADLVRSGKLRAGIGVVAPHWAVKDSATGQLRGVSVDIAQALASRLGVQLVMVESPSPPAVLDGLKTGAWDVGFLALIHCARRWWTSLRLILKSMLRTSCKAVRLFRGSLMPTSLAFVSPLLAKVSKKSS